METNPEEAPIVEEQVSGVEAGVSATKPGEILIAQMGDVRGDDARLGSALPALTKALAQLNPPSSEPPAWLQGLINLVKDVTRAPLDWLGEVGQKAAEIFGSRDHKRSAEEIIAETKSSAIIVMAAAVADERGLGEQKKALDRQQQALADERELMVAERKRRLMMKSAADYKKLKAAGITVQEFKDASGVLFVGVTKKAPDQIEPPK